LVSVDVLILPGGRQARPPRANVSLGPLYEFR
jgi:hypothetical protein